MRTITLLASARSDYCQLILLRPIHVAATELKGGNVTSAGWQVTLCDPMWHVSSRSGVATLRTAIHLLLTYLLTEVAGSVHFCYGDVKGLFLRFNLATYTLEFTQFSLRSDFGYGNGDRRIYSRTIFDT